MEVVGEDQALQAVLGRADFSGIDNEALDFSQLEDYINDEEDTAIYFPESLATNACEVKVPENVPNLVKTPCRPQTGPLLFNLTNSFRNGPNGFITQPHSLPESPPDSGSEPPFSPADEATHGKMVLPTATAPSLQEMLMQPPATADAVKHLMTYSNTHPLKHLPDGIPHALEPHHNSSLPTHNSNLMSLSPMFSNGLPPTSTSSSNNSHQNKKRKLSDSPSAASVNGGIQVKQEPGSVQIPISSRHCLSPDPGSNHSQTLTVSDEDYTFDFTADPSLAFMDSAYQCIRFQPFQQQSWHTICDANLKELPVPNYRVDADKGFNFSNADDAFVCQKKNHFQVTIHVQVIGEPHYVKTPEGLKKIDNFYLHFNGVKVESLSQSIKVEQSQSDRSKKPFHPIQLEFSGDQVTKLTVGRLHFSETTSNNMRKKGKPNPDQRYFYLVVGLHAHSGDANYVIASHSSERIIVRASNPGQFENDVELCWQKGHTQDSIYHAGRVGINTDRPDESLVIHGNVKLTGHIMQPSDARVKENVQEIDTKEQLRNLQQLRIVRYQYNPDFSRHMGLLDEHVDTGVIAQDVQNVLPDAVKEAGDIILPNGQHIANFLVVNKERIFMENVGAVKELCKVTDNLENRIDELERMNRKLSKLKRIDSLKSSSSASTVISHSSSIPSPSVTSSSRRYHHRRRKLDDHGLCSNKFVQLTIAILIIIMALCLIAMATLYILEWQTRHANPISHYGIEMQPPYSPNSSSSTTSTPRKTTRRFSIITEKPESTTHQPTHKHVPLNKLNTLINQLTEATTTHLDNTVKPPYARKKRPEIGFPKRCTVVTGRTPCPAYCCDQNVLINTVSPDDGSNPPLYHLEPATLSPQPSQVLDIYDNPSEANEESSNENPPYINGQNSVAENNSPNDDEKERSHVSHLLKKREGKPHNTMAKSRSEFLNVFQSIFIPELNITIGSEYADSNQWSSWGNGNFSFSIPVSPYMPNQTLTLQFQFSSTSGIVVDLCQMVNTQGCQFFENLRHLDERREGEVAFWRLPIGHFVKSSYKFRLPNRGMRHQEVCNATDRDVGSTYLEFNFAFYRKCEHNTSHVTNSSGKS